jgi:uncharacterized membrane protein YsdA (DUF1294 family)
LGRTQRIFSIIALFVGAILFVFLLSSTNWNPYVVWLIAWSITTFVLYGFDKFQAGREGWRAPEITLHGLALLGGVLGGWAGMFVFWHKVRHVSFWTILILSTLIHGALVYFLLLR